MKHPPAARPPNVARIAIVALGAIALTTPAMAADPDVEPEEPKPERQVRAEIGLHGGAGFGAWGSAPDATGLGTQNDTFRRRIAKRQPRPLASLSVGVQFSEIFYG